MLKRTLLGLALFGFSLVAHAAPDAAVGLDFGALQRSYHILSSGDVDDDTKRLEIDALFAQTQVLCEQNCALAVANLTEWNAGLSIAPLGTLLDQVPAVVRDQVTQAVPGLTPEAVKQGAARLQEYIAKADPAKLSRQIAASLELLRYLISIEEKNLFALSSTDAALRSAALTAMRGDLQSFSRQARALQDLLGALKQLQDKPANAPALARVVKDIDELGIFYMKLAQSLSNASGLPADITAALQSYQDDVKVMAPEDVRRILREELGRDPETVFIGFDAANPLKSGTVAQTYRAKIRTLLGTRDVIIKVQRPGLEEQLDWNRRVNHAFLKIGQVTAPEKFAWVIDLLAGAVGGIEDAFEGELDFRIEARNLARFRRQFFFSRSVRVPRVYGKYSSRRVLVMEAIPGQNIDRMLEQTGAGELIARKKLFSRLFDAFFYQLLAVGEMHADMHPGNILVTDAGKIGLIDWGQTYRSRGVIGEPAQLFFDLFTGDADGWVGHLAKMGELPDDQREAFVAFVHAKFAENEIEENVGLRALPGVLFGSGQIHGAWKLLPDLLRASVEKFKFRASPQYLQFFRSAAPVTSTLIKIAAGIPKNELRKLLIWKGLGVIPKAGWGYVQARALDVLSCPQVFTK